MRLKTIFPLITAIGAILISSCASTNIFKSKATKEKTPEPVAAQSSDGYLIATKMINPETGQPVKDHYISPFKPYNPIVAKGFKSGQLAGDPSTIQVNPETGKAVKSTMKIFKLP